MRTSLAARLDRLASRPAPAAQDGAVRGAAELRRLGIDLGKLTNAELDWLELLAGAWPDDGTKIPAGAVYAVLGS
jgi:hypothetical protein